MNIDSWLYTKLATSSNVNTYTTKVYPVFAPTTSLVPYLIYDTIGFEKNRNMKNKVFTITTVNNSKSGVESINDVLFSLFDNSTKFQKETSSSLHVESISIVNNAVCLYDDTNKYWQKVLDISVWYS